MTKIRCGHTGQKDEGTWTAGEARKHDRWTNWQQSEICMLKREEEGARWRTGVGQRWCCDWPRRQARSGGEGEWAVERASRPGQQRKGSDACCGAVAGE